MKRVLKCTLGSAVTVLTLPRGSELLHFDTQKQIPTVWFMSDGYVFASERVELRIFMTGDEVPDDYQYFDTVLTHDGNTVLHLFYKYLVD